MTYDHHTDTTDVTKEAADWLKAQYKGRGIQVGSSHTHAVVAHYLGYGSRKALLSDEYMDVSDKALAFRYEPDESSLKNGISRMRSDSPYKSLKTDSLMSDIRVALTPPCECCDEKRDDVVPIGYVDDVSDLEDSSGWVSLTCAAELEALYGTCWCCGDHVIHRSEDLNRAGECEEHAGESNMDKEERDGWEDIIENLNK